MFIKVSPALDLEMSAVPAALIIQAAAHKAFHMSDEQTDG